MAMNRVCFIAYAYEDNNNCMTIIDKKPFMKGRPDNLDTHYTLYKSTPTNRRIIDIPNNIETN